MLVNYYEPLATDEFSRCARITMPAPPWDATAVQFAPRVSHSRLAHVIPSHKIDRAARVLDFLTERRGQFLTARAIAQQTGLSGPDVTSLLTPMVAAGVITAHKVRANHMTINEYGVA